MTKPLTNHIPLSPEVATASLTLAAEVLQQADRLQVAWPTMSKEMEILISELRTTIVQARAVAEEVKNVMAPYREMYKDERLSKAKADALRAAIPELVVDTIIKEFHLSKFPTIGTLMKRLGDSENMKKLKAGGHGTSRATIARWLKVVRKIMHQSGAIEKYRVRFADLPVSRYDQIHHSAEVEYDPPETVEAGFTKRDTRGQELGNDYAAEPAD